MKLIRTVTLGLLATVAILSGTTSHAASATSTFQVNLSLTPKCYVNMTAAPADALVGDVSLSYTSFQSTTAKASTGFTVTCTNTLPYSVAVTSDTGSVLGITYFLSLAAGTTASYATATGAGALASQAGNGTAQSYTVGVQAGANQAGTCATTAACTGNNAHTVTVTY